MSNMSLGTLEDKIDKRVETSKLPTDSLGHADSSLLIASGYRRHNLDKEERFLPAQEQVNRLIQRGYVEVGTFSIRLDPETYGVPFAALNGVVNTYETMRNSIGAGSFNPKIYNALLKPLLEQAKFAAPTLAEFSPIPQGFVNAARAGKIETEAVYTGFNTGNDNRGQYIQANARVFIRKTNY
jgi:hypothetical protein